MNKNLIVAKVSLDVFFCPAFGIASFRKLYLMHNTRKCNLHKIVQFLRARNRKNLAKVVIFSCFTIYNTKIVFA